jgi:hypothetical protein
MLQFTFGFGMGIPSGTFIYIVYSTHGVLNTIQRTGGAAPTPARKNATNIYYSTSTHRIQRN